MKILRLIPVFIFLVFLSSCEKDDDVENIVSIKGSSNNLGTVILRPTFLEYEVEGSGIESVILWVDNQQVDSQDTLKGYFHFVFEELGEYTVKFSVLYNGGKEKMSNEFSVFVSEYEAPNIQLKIRNLNDYFLTFVGDTLGFELSTESSSFYFFDKEYPVSLIVDGDTLGSCIGEPYYYESLIIEREEYTFNLSYKDNWGAFRMIEFDREFEVNPPTEVEVSAHTYVFDDVPLKLTLEAEENTEISKVEMYLNNELIHSEEVNYYRYFENIDVNELSPGVYEFYALVYDDRFHMVSSDTLEIYVNHKANIEPYDQIIKLQKSKVPYLSYGLSSSKLYIINEDLEEFEVVNLPFDYAVAMDLDDNGLLYVISKYGKLGVWNQDSQEFQFINTGKFFEVKDMDVYNEREIFLISKDKLYHYNIETGDSMSCSINLSDDARLGLDKSSSVIIVGGDEHSTDSRFYKVSFFENNFEIQGNENLVGFVKDIIINPYKGEFLVMCTGQSDIIWDIEDFGSRKADLYSYWTSSVCYGHDYSEIALANRGYNHLFIYNSETYSLNKDIYLRLNEYEDILYLSSTSIENKWLVYTESDNKNVGKIAFLTIYE